MIRTDLINIRDYRAGDEALILSTWLKGLLYGGGPAESFFQKIPKDIFYANHHVAVEKILSGPSTSIKIACLKEDPEVILGYAVYRTAGGQTVLDYVFVKKDWRNIGIAKSLCPKDVYAVTNLTKAGESILSKYPKIVYNPYLA